MPGKLEILRNSGYDWAKEAAEIIEDLVQALEIADEDLIGYEYQMWSDEDSEKYRQVLSVIKKVKEWK